VLFMGGIIGRLMHEFAVTITAAILVSGVVSISLTPMLCSRFLKPPHSIKHAVCSRPPSVCSTRFLSAYAWSLRLTLRFRAVAMIVSASSLPAPSYLFEKVPTGFIPSQDMKPAAGADSKVRRGSAFRRWPAKYAEPPKSSRRIQHHDRVRHAPRAQPGAVVPGIEAARGTRALTPIQIIEELRPSWRASRASA
jgi:HAE1 family hydrophobic/amphiphilic exporter-1